MLFSTPFFLFVFLPIFSGLYWFLPLRRPLLLIGSVVFYAWGEPVFIWVVCVSGLFDWLLGRWLTAITPEQRGWRKFLVGCGVAANLGLLIYFKYAAFAVGNLNSLLASAHIQALPIPAIALPLGVSFIVFEKITYLVDLYRGTAKPASSLLDYGNYVLLFPKLLAGPIIKYYDISDQLARPSHRYEDVRDGLIRFIQGLAKKTIIADTIAPVADSVFTLPVESLDPSRAWLGLLCFTLQIYFDFSGYSDMAIGLGRILGFRILENFNQPYLATSVTDFWRRWHISLSTWIKEYLYIPLGGNRVSTARAYVNLCVCFVLSGLWHGASWNFLLWGCAHGVALVADRAFWLKAQRVLPRGVNMALTFLCIMLTWVFFRCVEFLHSVWFFRALAGATDATGAEAAPVPSDVIFTIGVGVVLILFPLLRGRADPSRHTDPAVRRLVELAACVPLLFFSVARMALSSFHPFLYFRF